MITIDVKNTPIEERQKHLDLTENCVERGGTSTQHKGVLAEYLDSNIPSGRILLCHYCNNPACSNPKHLYWGTDKENVEDSKRAGTRKSFWQNMVDKYGLEEARKRQSQKAKGNSGGHSQKGKPKSEEHKRKISESLKNNINARVVERDTQCT